MFRTFNYGIGMVLVVPEESAEDIVSRLHGLNEEACIIGEIATCKGDCNQVDLI